MKITKQELKQIIEEELGKVAVDEEMFSGDTFWDRADAIFDAMGPKKAYEAILQALPRSKSDFQGSEALLKNMIRMYEIPMGDDDIEEKKRPVNEKHGYTNLDDDVYGGLDNVLQLVRASETLEPELKEKLEMGILDLIGKLDADVMPYEKRRYNI